MMHILAAGPGAATDCEADCQWSGVEWSGVYSMNQVQGFIHLGMCVRVSRVQPTDPDEA